MCVYVFECSYHEKILLCAPKGIYKIMKWNKMVNAINGVMVMREKFKTWNEILIVFWIVVIQ